MKTNSKNILVLFGADSGLEWGRSFQIAKAFHYLGHKVLYIDLPFPIYKSLYRSQKKSCSTSTVHFPVLQPKRGLPYSRYKFLRPINRVNIFKQIKKFVNYHWQDNPDLMWVYSPYDPYITKLLRKTFSPTHTIYDCADDRVAMAEQRIGPKEANFVQQLEKELVDDCDIVFTITEHLKKIKSNLHRNIIVLPNGVDTEMFSDKRTLDVPEEYKKLSGKIVLYLGSLEVWVDIELIKDCARIFPKFSFVLVGPARVEIDSLKEHKNIFLLGPKPFVSTPSYIIHSDLCIIPFRQTESLKSSSTLKVLQYIGMKKPVLSTNYEGINKLEGLISVAISKEDFINKVQTLCSDKTKQFKTDSLNKILKSHSWKNIAQQALGHLDTIKN